MKKQNNIMRRGTLLFASLIMGVFGLNSGLTFAEETQAAPINKGDFVQDLVVRSDLIFRGTLVDKSESLSIEGIPHTFVTYYVSEVIAGNYSDGLITLKYVGGEFENGNRLTASNAPEVEVGEDSILMVQQSIESDCDFVDCEHGRFVLREGEIIAANESTLAMNEKKEVAYTTLVARGDSQFTFNAVKSNVSGFINHIKSIKSQKSLNKPSLDRARSSESTSVVSADLFAPFKASSGLTQPGQAPTPPDDVVEDELQGSQFDQWEVERLRQNGGNPLL